MKIFQNIKQSQILYYLSNLLVWCEMTLNGNSYGEGHHKGTLQGVRCLNIFQVSIVLWSGVHLSVPVGLVNF
jgi:hypothetical protein